MDYRALFSPSTPGMAKRVERIDDAARADPSDAWSEAGALPTLRDLLVKSEHPFVIAGVRIQRRADFEAELLAALARLEGSLIEVMLEPGLIRTRGMLARITQAALKRSYA